MRAVVSVSIATSEAPRDREVMYSDLSGCSPRAPTSGADFSFAMLRVCSAVYFGVQYTRAVEGE